MCHLFYLRATTGKSSTKFSLEGQIWLDVKGRPLLQWAKHSVASCTIMMLYDKKFSEDESLLMNRQEI